MKLLIATVAFLIAGFGGCNKVHAASVGQAMNVSGAGSEYIFVYRGNNPNEFDALVAQGLNNLSGWLANCVSSNCTKPTLIIDHATLPDPDYLFLYTRDASGAVASPDSGQWYSFNSPPPPPAPLCCGGSATVLSNQTNVARAQSFITRPTRDSQIYIEQIGENNSITVQSSGTVNNYVKYVGNGSNNNIEVTQGSNTPSGANYTDLHIVGNSNTALILQQGSGGVKGAFVNVQDNNNVLTLQQTGAGNHYAEVSLTGGNKTVDILQSGPASHMANVTLTGLPASLNLQQTGSAQQSYSINFNCATSGGCAPISVKQGQ